MLALSTNAQYQARLSKTYNSKLIVMSQHPNKHSILLMHWNVQLGMTSYSSYFFTLRQGFNMWNCLIAFETWKCLLLLRKGSDDT